MKIVIAAIAMFASTAVSAMAADAIGYGTSGSPDEVPVTDTAMDWSGFYAGIYGVTRTGGDADAQLGLALAAGINQSVDFLLVGGEVSVQFAPAERNDPLYAQAIVRGGLLVTDDLAVYGAAGYGLDVADGSGNVLVGGGIEYAISDDVSVRGQYLQGLEFGDDEPTRQVTVGASFHF